MELVRKKDNRTGFAISVAVHIGLLSFIFIARGCIEIQNPPQFTLEEVVILDFSEAGGGNPGSSAPKATIPVEESPAEKQVTQEESPVSTPTSNSNETSSESKPPAEPAPEKPKNDFSNLFGKGSGDTESGNGEGEGTGIGSGKGPNTGGGMGDGKGRQVLGNPKLSNPKSWVGLVAVQFVVDKDGNIISTTVLPTSKLTTINLTKEDQSFIEKDCKEKFKFSSGSGNDRFVLKMKYALE